MLTDTAQDVGIFTFVETRNLAANPFPVAGCFAPCFESRCGSLIVSFIFFSFVKFGLVDQPVTADLAVAKLLLQTVLASVDRVEGLSAFNAVICIFHVPTIHVQLSHVKCLFVCV